MMTNEKLLLDFGGGGAKMRALREEKSKIEFLRLPHYQIFELGRLFLASNNGAVDVYTREGARASGELGCACKTIFIMEEAAKHMPCLHSSVQQSSTIKSGSGDHDSFFSRC